jgi:hypothetical protein
MYNISEDLQLKPREKITETTYTNTDNEKIINKYNKLYQPSNDLQRRI